MVVLIVVSGFLVVVALRCFAALVPPLLMWWWKRIWLRSAGDVMRGWGQEGNTTLSWEGWL